MRVRGALTLTGCLLAGLLLPACGDDDDGSGDSPRRATAAPSIATIQDALEARLEEPGLNALIVESVTCTRPEAEGDVSCTVAAESADSVGHRNGTLDLSPDGSDPQVFKINGTLGDPGLTNSYENITLRATPVRKATPAPGFKGEVETALTDTLEGPGVTSLLVTSVNCSAPAEPAPGESFTCTVEGRDREEGTTLKGTVTLEGGGADGRKIAMTGSVTAPGQEFRLRETFSVPAG